MKQSQPKPEMRWINASVNELFTVADVLANFNDFEELEADNDADYPDNDLESVTESDIRVKCSTDSDSDVKEPKARSRQT